MEIKEIRQQKSEVIRLITTAEVRTKLKHIAGLLFAISTDIGLQEQRINELTERNAELEQIAVDYDVLLKKEQCREAQRQISKQRYREKIEKSLAENGQTSGQKE